MPHQQYLDCLNNTLNYYIEKFPDDAAAAYDLQSLIASGADVTSRTEFRGHIVCGAIAIRHGRHGLMVNHIALERWLFPGGHVEAGDKTLKNTALRELAEETNLDISQLNQFGLWCDQYPLHMGCHEIPENREKQEPAHLHYDFLYIFDASSHQNILSTQKEEVSDLKWFDVQDFDAKIRTRLQKLDII
jgi:8-oxo-dGTP pyrophosphatase MutT (NUDIX family)